VGLGLDQFVIWPLFGTLGIGIGIGFVRIKFIWLDIVFIGAMTCPFLGAPHPFILGQIWAIFVVCICVFNWVFIVYFLCKFIEFLLCRFGREIWIVFYRLKLSLLSE